MNRAERVIAALLFPLLVMGCLNSRGQRRVAESEAVIEADDADRLLALSREADWTYPTSSGRPVASTPPAWLDRVAAEQSAYVDAIRTLQERGDVEAATEIAANTWRLWVLQRQDAEGRAMLALVLDRASGESRALALAMYGDSLLAFRLGDLEASRVRAEAALACAASVHDARAEALAHLALSRVEFSDGRYEQAREHASASLSLARGLEPGFRQAPLHMLAQATRFEGDPNDAASLFRESLALNQELGDLGMVAVEQHNLGHVELGLGHVDVAQQLFEQCASSGDDPYGVAMTRFNEASIAHARGETERALDLLRQARETLSDAGIEFAADDALEFQRLERRLDAPNEGPCE